MIADRIIIARDSSGLRHRAFGRELPALRLRACAPAPLAASQWPAGGAGRSASQRIQVAAAPSGQPLPSLFLRLPTGCAIDPALAPRSEEHTSELPSLMRISYAVFYLTTINNIG